MLLLGWMLLAIIHQVEGSGEKEQELPPQLYCNLNILKYCPIENFCNRNGVCELCPDSLLTGDACRNITENNADYKNCQFICDLNQEGLNDDFCDRNTTCDYHHFCNFQDGDDGACEPRPDHRSECLALGGLSKLGNESCLESCSVFVSRFTLRTQMWTDMASTAMPSKVHHCCLRLDCS